MENQTNEPSPIVTDSPKAQRKSIIREAMSTIGVLVVAFLVAIALISFVFQSYQVDGPSMQTTLYDQDRLIVWKLARTWSRVTHNQYVPQRGDVIVFVEKGLAEYGQDNSKQLIKRVIGLPGDHVVVRDGTITIYNKDHPDGFQPDKTLPYGKVIPFTAGNIDITLGDHQLYVCGDNRPDSLDSRTFGPIDTNQIVGKLILRVFPLNEVKTF